MHFCAFLVKSRDLLSLFFSSLTFGGFFFHWSAPRFAWGSCMVPLNAPVQGFEVSIVAFGHDLVARKLCRFSKMNFQEREIFKGFSIDKLSGMTLVLDTSLFPQKTTFKNDKMRSHESLYFLFFYLKHSQSNILFCFTRLRHPHQTWRTSNFWLNRLWDKLRSANHLSKQTNDLYSHSNES